MSEIAEQQNQNTPTVVESNGKSAKFSLKHSARSIFMDVLVCFIAALLVSSSLYYFSNYNSFAPGGVTGFASILGSLIAKCGIPALEDVTLNMSVLMFSFNLPIFLAVALCCRRKTGFMLIIYLVSQVLLLLFFKFLHSQYGLPYYAALPTDPLYEVGNNVIWASIGVGVISGLGYSLMLRRFGASGGTYAISALIKRFHPEKNIPWLAFALDSSVVILALFIYDAGMNSVISTLTNIFISNLVVDYMLQGIRSGYKFEVITDRPEELAKDLMENLHRGVTLLHAEGMYTHTHKAILICIIRKRQIGEFLTLLKSHGATFSYSCKVNEVYGKFQMIVEDEKNFFTELTNQEE
ncbi:MAG: YitT family protein [Clostridia bacterium]|nr:YitT family protein [Clostridia bacterium]